MKYLNDVSNNLEKTILLAEKLDLFFNDKIQLNRNEYLKLIKDLDGLYKKMKEFTKYI